MPHPAIATGRTAVVTGGASGIGLATAERLAAAGMNVCIADLETAERVDRISFAVAAQSQLPRLVLMAGRALVNYAYIDDRVTIRLVLPNSATTIESVEEVLGDLVETAAQLEASLLGSAAADTESTQSKAV